MRAAPRRYYFYAGRSAESRGDAFRESCRSGAHSAGEVQLSESGYPINGGGPVGPTFFAMDVKERTCQRCGADYTAHGSRLECPGWAFARQLEEQQKEKK